ncbi:hypothetical protein QYE76_037953 [Lolium multiflorum]|uniref:Uncharacterized protein n=1 Tax=Lolium multiflorum TaxID=4521 RepID=A0AAD8T6J1_LOLMU|nr:hypothetical protein QYE76_037953 [Lolium multiflorum]
MRSCARHLGNVTASAQPQRLRPTQTPPPPQALPAAVPRRAAAVASLLRCRRSRTTPPSSRRSSWPRSSASSAPATASAAPSSPAAEAASRLRLRLALDARAPLLPAAPGILRRFSAVSKLALKCDRRADSVGDPALVLVARRLGPGLRRLKLRSLRAVTDDGVHALASAAVNLRKLPVGSYAFGARGIEAALRSCTQLEELSVKRLRGLASSDPITVPGPRLQSLSMMYALI